MLSSAQRLLAGLVNVMQTAKHCISLKGQQRENNWELQKTH